MKTLIICGFLAVISILVIFAFFFPITNDLKFTELIIIIWMSVWVLIAVLGLIGTKEKNGLPLILLFTLVFTSYISLFSTSNPLDLTLRASIWLAILLATIFALDISIIFKKEKMKFLPVLISFLIEGTIIYFGIKWISSSTLT